MTENQKYFLAVAEELNISKTAKKLYISQQCLSNHIRRMEETYGQRLFIRRPKLALTPSGCAVAHALYQIQIVESGLNSKLSELNSNIHGFINLGITRARTPLIMPDIVNEFNRMYPDFEIILNHEKTENLEKQVLNGKLDFFIGISSMEASDLHYELLADEQIFLVISDNLLHKLFPNFYEQIKIKTQKGVDLRDFQGAPFVLNAEGEGLHRSVKYLAFSAGAKINVIFQTDDPLTRVRLCNSDFCASVIPEMMLVYTTQEYFSENLNCFPFDQTYASYKLVLGYLIKT